jgi:hypothetical protein
MTFPHALTRPAWRIALGLLVISSGTALAQGIPDRLELHGSLNAAYGRSHELPVIGIPTTGTSDYRVFTLQGRYALTENDQIVAQVFNRRIGTSPLAAAVADVTMQWAYYQHRAGDFTFKVGRSPLPRGFENETRYIGTVHSFFRPSVEVQQDAFDAFDGAVVSYRHELGLGVELEQHGFAGGSENRVVATTLAGQEVRNQRTENMYGGQTVLRLPFAGARLGVYGARYDIKTATTAGSRTNVFYSAEVTPIDRLKLESEYSRTSGVGPSNDTRAAYVEATLRLHDRFSIAGQHSILDRMLFFANTDMNFVLPDVKDDGASAIFHLTNNSVLKVEHHWRSGWTYDVPMAPVASQTATDVTLSPRRNARYFLVSVAASF